MTPTSGDPYAHLRANAATQKQTTINRLRQAITQLEAEGRPVNTFTIKEVSGMDYMSYYGLLGPPEKFTTLSPQQAQECEISTSALAFRQPRENSGDVVRKGRSCPFRFLVACKSR